MNIKFDDYLPKLPHGDLAYDGDEYFKVDTAQPCHQCQELTHWVSLSFMGTPLCGTECADAMWRELSEAAKIANEHHPWNPDWNWVEI